MKKICTTSVLFLLILINKNFSQYTFVEDPADQTFECMPSNSNFDPILDYLNGLSAIEVNCNGIDAILTWDYTGEFPSCDESVNIVITAEDACGDFPNQEYPIVVTIFDTQAPYIEFIAEPEPIECVKEIILNQGFENVINALIDDALAFDTNACTDPNDLIWFITPDHTIPPQAADIPDLNCPGGSLTGTYEFEVLVEDECGNRSQPETISIVVQDTKSPAFPMALPPDLYLECLEDMEGGMEQFPNDDCEAPPAIMVEVQISDFCTYEFERKWIFEDYCGNVAGEHIQAIFVKDTTAPTWIGDTSLFLPQDITVYIDDCTEPYYFPNNYFESELTGEAWPHFPLENNVHFEDNCDGVSFRQLVIPPSEAFPEGVTKITYIVRDECFNVLKHEFTVSVVCNNCFTSGIVTESCNTEPDAFFCEMTDLFGHIACTPPDTLGEPVWPFPDQLCDGVGEATNISWFSFVASSKDMCLFASVLNCKTNNKSLSAGIYDSCENDNGQCIVSDATCDNDGYVRLVTRDLIVGREYFLFVAGCDGAVCSFEFNSCPGFYIEIDPEAQLTHEACTDEVLKISYFLDTNKNQIQDVGEESIEVNESFVKIKDDHDVFLFFDNNQECFLVEPRTYELEFINENFIPSNLPQFITIEDDEGTRELHIALCVNEDLPVNDLDIRIAALLTERCNRVVPLRIKLTNIGNTAIRDTFTLNYDTLIEKRTVDLPSVTSIPGQIQWIIDLPNPLQTQEITVNFKMPTAEYTGDIFCLSPKFNLSDSDFTEHCFTLRCPYDPNDKKGQPLRGGDNPVLNEEEFLYTIRFENLGNDTAFNVRIEDTLSTFLNASTFRYIQSSHDISRYYVNNDRVAKLYFDNINLVSIAQDSTLNKGFVQYAIKMNEDLSPNTVINNEAFIYFDDNAFVKTNNTSHTVVEILPMFIDNDNDGFTADVDCDDNNSLSYPGTLEICDGEDNDCNGIVDDNIEGYSNPSNIAVNSTDETIEIVWDINPFVIDYIFTYNVNESIPISTFITGNSFTIQGLAQGDEVKLTIESRFNGGCENLSIEVCASTNLIDTDDDGFGSDTDCNDSDPEIYPGALEICDGIDNDCDGIIDEDLDFTTYYEDNDGDGFGNDLQFVEDCTLPNGYVTNNMDCDDNDSEINPDSEEICDGIDNDCDGIIDEDLNFTVYYEDNDGDGYGNDLQFVEDCTRPNGYVTNNMDCDDTDSEINPDAEDIPNNGIDENCDGEDFVTSLKEDSSSPLNIFPNPASDILFIKGESIDQYNLELISTEGKVLEKLTDRNDISHLANGFYIIRIINSEGKLFLETFMKY